VNFDQQARLGHWNNTRSMRSKRAIPQSERMFKSTPDFNTPVQKLREKYEFELKKKALVVKPTESFRVRLDMAESNAKCLEQALHVGL